MSEFLKSFGYFLAFVGLAMMWLAIFFASPALAGGGVLATFLGMVAWTGHLIWRGKNG